MVSLDPLGCHRRKCNILWATDSPTLSPTSHPKLEKLSAPCRRSEPIVTLSYFLSTYRRNCLLRVYDMRWCICYQAMRGDHLASGDRLSETILSSEMRSLRPSKAPMIQQEFQHFLDSDGKLIKPLEFRQSVYHGGIDASIRRSLWPHLLNIYPQDITGEFWKMICTTFISVRHRRNKQGQVGQNGATFGSSNERVTDQPTNGHTHLLRGFVVPKKVLKK